MSASDLSFCPSLQKDWSIENAKYARGIVKLLLKESKADEVPDPRGRPGFLVMAEPRVYRVHETAEVTFENVLWFEVVDEVAFSVSGLAQTTGEEYDGHRFRCYSKSALLTDQRKSRTDTDAANLKHYQLVTSDEIVNVVTSQAPQIVLQRTQG